MIVGKLPLTSIYFYFSTRVYLMAASFYWRFTGQLQYMLFLSIGLLLLCNPVLRGINMCGYGPYIMSYFRATPVTAVIWDNPVAIGNPVLRALPRTSEFWVISTVISNCLWTLSKLYICIFLPHRIEEVCGKGYGGLFIIFDINRLFLLIQNILQAHFPGLTLLIFGLCFSSTWSVFIDTNSFPWVW